MFKVAAPLRATGPVAGRRNGIALAAEGLPICVHVAFAAGNAYSGSVHLAASGGLAPAKCGLCQMWFRQDKPRAACCKVAASNDSARKSGASAGGLSCSTGTRLVRPLSDPIRIASDAYLKYDSWLSGNMVACTRCSSSSAPADQWHCIRSDRELRSRPGLQCKMNAQPAQLMTGLLRPNLT